MKILLFALCRSLVVISLEMDDHHQVLWYSAVYNRNLTYCSLFFEQSPKASFTYDIDDYPGFDKHTHVFVQDTSPKTQSFNCETVSQYHQGQCGCTHSISTMLPYDFNGIAYLCASVYCEVTEYCLRDEQRHSACFCLCGDRKSGSLVTVLANDKTHITLSCGTESLHNSLKVESVKAFSLNVVYNISQYFHVNKSGQKMEHRPISIDNNIKVPWLDFIKSNLNYIICFLAVLCLLFQSPHPHEYSKQDMEESLTYTIFNRGIQLKGLTKHLFQSYISPNIKEIVCCPATEHTPASSNNKSKRDDLKSGRSDGNNDSDSDYTNARSPGHGTQSKPGKASKRRHVPNVKMAHEWDRYITYGKCLDDAHCKNIFETTLTKNGFYFNIEKNRSECFSCGLKVRKWDEDESVEDTHLKLSPDCDFANGKDTFNVPIHKDEKHNAASESEQAGGASGGEENVKTQTSDETLVADREASKSDHSNRSHGKGNRQRNETETSREETSYIEDTLAIPFDVLSENARHPDLASRENRMSTYLNWAYTHVVSIKRLVDAGLFNTGTSDETRCFHCGGGIRNWQQGDDPWMEHAFWFPDCEYVRQCRGQEFIDMVRMGRAFERGLDIAPSHRTLQPTEEERYTETQTFCRHRANPRFPPSDPATVQMPDFSMVDSVADMGFNKEHVLLALGQIRRNHSEGYRVEPEELIDYLLANPQTDPPVITPERSTDGSEAARPKKHKQKNKKSNEIRDSVASTENPDISFILDENQKLKQQLTCKVCMDSDACVVFLPCGHMVTCVKCSSALRKCAICRAKIHGNIRVYMG